MSSSSNPNPISDLGNAVNKAVKQVGDVGQAIINNPLPIIETSVLTAALGPEGIALSSAIGAPATAAVSAAAVEAANGGNVNQIATAAASAGVGSEVTQLVAPEVGPSPISGAATNSTNPLASAAGGAAGGATRAALTGQDVAKGALTGGAVSGLASAGAQEVSSLTSPGPMSGTGQTVSTNALPQVSQDDPTSTEGLKLPSSALGLKLPSSVLTGETVAPAEPQAPGIQYTLSPTVFTPGGVDYGFTRATPTDTLTSTPQTTPGMSPEAQSALQSVFGFGLSTALAPKSPGLGAISASTTGVGSSGGSTGTTSSTTGGSPGGTELDPSTGKAPELAWGDKYSSLKEGLNV